MTSVRADRLGFSGRALSSAVDISRGREQRLATQLDAMQSYTSSSNPLTNPVGFATEQIAKLIEVRRLTHELATEREFLADASVAAAKAERDLKIEVERGAEDRRRQSQQEYTQWGMAGSAAFERAKNPWNPNAGGLQQLAADKERNAYDAINQKIEARRRLTGALLQTELLSIDAQRKIRDAIAEGNYELAKRLTSEGQKSGAKTQLAQYGIGMVASQAGAYGGMISGVGNALLSGNPWGAAVAGVTGLIDGIIGSGKAAEEAAKAHREMQRAYQAFTDGVRLSLGDITDTEAAIRETKRQFDLQREAVWQSIVKGPGGISKVNERYDAGMKKIAELNELERRRIEQLGKEADELERLNTAFRNAPKGFFVEQYLQRVGAGYERAARPGERPGFGSSGSGVTLVLQAGAIQVNGNRSDVEMAQGVVNGLRQLASSTVGTNVPLSTALDLMS
jgi:hypothetical protein